MDNLNKKLGLRIRRLRTKRNLSQDNVAEKAGLSAKHLGKIERGESNASIQCLTNIANALEVSMHDVLDYDHERNEKELMTEMHGMLDRLTPKDAQMVYRIMKMLIDG